MIYSPASPSRLKTYTEYSDLVYRYLDGAQLYSPDDRPKELFVLYPDSFSDQFGTAFPPFTSHLCDFIVKVACRYKNVEVMLLEDGTLYVNTDDSSLPVQSKAIH